jgi:nuclear pore complex protein Nup93
MLERDLKLIHLTSEASYLSSIVRAAALRADHERRFSNSIQLYNLCGDYDAVISVLNAELGRSLALPATSTPSSAVDYFKEGNESLSLAVESEDVVHVARTVLDHFDRQGGMGGKVSRKNRTTCEALMKLKEGMSLFQSGHYDQALAVRPPIFALLLYWY